MDNSNLEKFLKNDIVIEMVEKMFIKLPMDDVKENKAFLNQILKDLVSRMKNKDTLFKKAYNKVVFCGSGYKGTKISNPDEFDINIVLNLRKCIIHPNDIQVICAQPGFIKIIVNDNLDYPDSPKYVLTDREKRQLRRLLDYNLLHPYKLRSWIQSIISDLNRQLPLDYSESLKLIKIKDSGPAFTLVFKIYNRERKFSVDIVPVLIFDTKDIINPINWKYTSTEWFAVPVPLKNIQNPYDTTLLPFWRQSFVYQENEILSQHGRIKKVIRLLKKLRDTWWWDNIASYFIETIILNKLADIKEILNEKSTTWLFYMMLEEMHDCFQQHRVEYFWDDGYNLLLKIGTNEMRNITGCLQHIIKRIKYHAQSNPLIIADQILDDVEFELLEEEYNRMLENMSITDNEDKGQNGWRCNIS